MKASQAKKAAAAAAQLELAKDEEAMEVAKEKPTFDPHTLKNEHGNYPVWMNRRQIKRHKKLTSKTAVEGYKKGRKRKRL